jgi:hypothetical protein
VRPLAIVFGDPCGDLAPRVVEIEEPRLVQELVAHPAIEAVDEGVLDRLARRNEVPIDARARSGATKIRSGSTYRLQIF